MRRQSDAWHQATPHCVHSAKLGRPCRHSNQQHMTCYAWVPHRGVTRASVFTRVHTHNFQRNNGKAISDASKITSHLRMFSLKRCIFVIRLKPESCAMLRKICFLYRFMGECFIRSCSVFCTAVLCETSITSHPMQSNWDFSRFSFSLPPIYSVSQLQARRLFAPLFTNQ